MKKKILLLLLISSLGAPLGVKALLPQAGEPIAELDPEDTKFVTAIKSRPKTGTPSNYSAVENLYIAAGVLKDTESYSTNVDGEVKAKVAFIDYNQTIKNRRVISGTDYFSEALSLSALKKVAEQRFVNGSSYLTRSGSDISSSGATWSQTVNSFSKEKYLTTYGNLPHGISHYVLNDGSIKSGIKVAEIGNKFTYSFEMDSIIAPEKYRREVAQMGGADSLPVFNDSTLVATMDQDWKILEIKTNSSYKMPIMGGLNCSEEQKETFTYYDEKIDIPEKSAFEPYFNALPDEGIVKEKTTTDYLMEAFEPILIGTGPIKAEGLFHINGKEIFLKAEVDLNNLNLKLSLNDKIFVTYDKQDIFVKLGTVEAKLSADELDELLNVFIPGFSLKNLDIKSLLDFQQMAGMLDTAEIQKTDTKIIAKLALGGGNVSLNMNISSDNKASLNYIGLNMELSDIIIDGSIVLTNKAFSFPTISAATVSLTGIKDYVEIIQNFIDAKSYLVDVSLDLSKIAGVPLKIDGTISAKIGDYLQVSADLIIKYENHTFPISLKLDDSTVYLTYQGNINVKLTINELMELAQKYLGFSLDNLAFDLNSIDFLKIISSLSNTENALSAKLNLSAFGLENEVAVGIYKTGTIQLAVKDIGSVQVKTGTFDFAVDQTLEYLDFNDITSYIDQVSKFITSDSYKISIAANIPLNGETLAVSGEAYITFKNGIEFNAQLTFAFNELKGTLSLAKVGEYYYLNYENIRVKMTLEEMKNLLLFVDHKFNLGLNLSPVSTSNIDINALPLREIIDSIKISKTGVNINIDTTLFGLDLGEIVVAYNKDSNLITLDALNGGVVVRVETNESYQYAVKDGFYLSYEQIKNYINVISAYIDNKKYSLSMNYDVIVENQLLNIAATAAIDMTGELKAELKLKLTYLTVRFDIGVVVKDNYIYLIVENSIKLKVGINDFAVIETFIKDTFNVDIKAMMAPILAAGTEKINLGLIGSVLKSITIDENQIMATLNLADIEASLDMKVSVKLKNDGTILVDLNQEEIMMITASCASTFEVAEGYYVETEELLNYVAKINELIAHQQYEVAVKGSTSIGAKTLAYEGNIKIDMSQAMKISAVLSLTYDNERFDILVKMVEGNIYVEYGDMIKAKLSISEITQLIEVIKNKFGLTLPEIALPELSVAGLLTSNNIAAVKRLIGRITLDENGIRVLVVTKDFGLDLGVFEINYDKATPEMISLSGENIAISLAKTAGFAVEVPTECLDYAAMSTYIDCIATLITQRQFAIDIDVAIKMGTTSISVKGDFYMDLSEGFDFVTKLRINYNNIVIDVELRKIADTFYVSVLGLDIKLLDSEFVYLLDEAGSSLDIDVSSIKKMLTEGFDISKFLTTRNVRSILDSFVIDQYGAEISVDPAIFGFELSPIKLRYDLLAPQGLTVTGEGIAISLNAIDKKTISPMITDITAARLVDVLHIIGTAKNYITSDSFSFNFGGSVTDVLVDEEKKSFEYNADVNVLFENTMFKAIQVDLQIDAVPFTENKASEAEHRISLIYYERDIFLNYNGKKMRLTIEETLSIVKYITTLLNIDISFLDGILGGIDAPIDTGGMFEQYFPKGEIVIADLLKDIDVLEGEEVRITLNNAGLYGYETANDSVVRIKTGGGKLIEASLDNLYASSKQYFNMQFNFNDFAQPINPPADANGYINLGSISSLLKNFIVTANLREWRMNGVVDVAFIKIFNISIKDLSVVLKLDEFNRPYGTITMTVPYFIAVTTNETKIKIHIYDEMIYVERILKKVFLWEKDKTIRYKMSLTDFAKDPLNNILGLCSFTNVVMNAITDAIEGTAALGHVMSFEKSFVDYNSPAINQYNLTLDGGDLTGDTNFHNIKVGIWANESDYINKLLVSTTLLGGDALSLKLTANLIDIGKVHDALVPNGIENNANYPLK